MLPEPDLRSLLPTLPHTTIYGPWSRAVHARHLLPPTPSPHPLWPYGAPMTGARYTPKGGFPTIYLASDLPAAYFEVESILAVPGVPPRLTRHPPLVFVAVDGLLSEMLDLTDDAIQTSLQTTYQELTGERRLTPSTGHLAPTQLLGKAAYESGRFLGLVAPSSKSPESEIVAVFYDRLMSSVKSELAVQDPDGHFAQRLP